ncbi:MAG: hypothetical protein FWD44_05590 [Oscillospiraceae bacterium]|nr:hypothetical protein [Oscillospiraceae bacterium]
MKRKKKNVSKTFIIYLIAGAAGLFLLSVGPILINYIFILESLDLNLNFSFSAGDILDYYGAILSGLVTCFAIISAIHINNANLREDRQRAKYERVFAVYHKLPEILSKLELAAIHVQYSIHLSDEALIETLDTMKECENTLREQHYVNDSRINKDIEKLLQQIITASVESQDCVERLLKIKESEQDIPEALHNELEKTFTTLRNSIANAKSEIMAEINKFLYQNEEA